MLLTIGQTIARYRKNSLLERCELARMRYTTTNQEGSSCTMKAEPELPSSKFDEASVSKLQRGRKQCLLAIVLNAFLNISSAYAQERREFVSDPVASSQAAEPSKFDTDCVNHQVLLIPATLGGATAPPMKLVDFAGSTCNSFISAPQREAGVRRSPSSHALTDAPQPLTDLSTAFIDTNASDTSGSPPQASGSRFTGLVPEFVNPSPPEGEEDGAESIGCEHDHACGRDAVAAAPGRAPESVQPKLGSTVRPAVNVGTRVSRRVLVGIAAWLVSWLALTCLLMLCSRAVYQRYLTPDAKLVRAAKAGLRKGEFRVEYQPLVSLREGRCVGVDALIRWDNVEYGRLGPSHYMSCIEQKPFIRPLTRFILSTAVRELGPLVASKSLHIGIKVAARHVESPTFVSDVIGSAGSILSHLVLQMPEEHCATPTEGVLDAVTTLRAKGVRLAMSGVTNVGAYWTFHKAFQFDLLKIDRSVLALDDGERRQRLATLVYAARELGSIAVAEGVESAIHHTEVNRSGTEFGQGFFYGRTMVLSLLATFLDAGGSSVRGRKVRLWK
ncbi:EAL domain-containing protein [Paraburkholderia sediminicola]|uniref:EAL domain-containing protein n=1 Tax=Paraburkholderia sediminicola TaxID=458836 RepID=UPI0038BD645A